MSDALRTMLQASASADTDELDPQALLSQVQDKIRRGIEPTDDEMRHVILAARAGRRSAATAQKKARTATPTISINTLFGTKQ